MDLNSSADAPSAPAFFEAYYDQIYRYVQSLVHNSAEAEDLTQETFLRAFRERESLRQPGALVAWLYRIATHATLDRLRQRARRAPREADVVLRILPQLGRAQIRTYPSYLLVRLLCRRNLHTRSTQGG